MRTRVRKRAGPPVLAWASGQAALLSLLLGLCAAGALAQEPAAETADADTAEDGSRRVDESEESFRARMELREQRFRERQRGTPTFSYSAAREGKLANLPPASQEHIRSQLRDLVVESRSWKPGEDLTGYPYEPSPAASRDPGLAGQEREAFIEQLQRYQQRAEADAAAGAGVAASAGKNGDGHAAAGTTSAPPVTAGATQSALDFLERQGLAAAGGTAATQGAAAAEAGESEGAGSGQGDRDRNGGEAPQANEQQAAGSSMGETSPDAPAGTIDIADLSRVEAALAATGSGAESREDAGTTMTMRDVPTLAPEPGTLDVDALRRLDPDLVGAGDRDR